MTAPIDVLIRRIEERIICAQCHAIYNARTRPPLRDLVCDVCGHAIAKRTDEEPGTITTRVHEFVRQTQPLVQYYRRQGILCEVNGAQELEIVEAEVDAALGLQGVS
jgi:adenylate kinase